jgi:hypothetical protein
MFEAPVDQVLSLTAAALARILRRLLAPGSRAHCSKQW